MPQNNFSSIPKQSNNNNVRQLILDRAKTLLERSSSYSQNANKIFCILNQLQKSPIHFLDNLSSQLSQQDFMTFIKEMQLRQFNNQQYIFEKGSKLSCGYILINGTASFNYHFDNSDDVEVIGEAEKGELISPDWLACGKLLPYSLKAIDNPVFFMFSEDSYSKFVKKWLIKIIDQQIDFLKNTPLFLGIDQPTMHKYYSYLFLKNYKYKDVLYCQNEENEYVYLILDGEVELRIKGVVLLAQDKNIIQNKIITNNTNEEIRLVKINRGEIFGCNLVSNKNLSNNIKDKKTRTSMAICSDQIVRVYKISKFIFEMICSQNSTIRKNISVYYQKIQEMHSLIAKKNIKLVEKYEKTRTKFVIKNIQNKQKKKKRRKKNKIGLENIQWWGLIENAKILEKCRLAKPQSLNKICSRKTDANDQGNQFDKTSMDFKINQLKKRILKGQLEDLHYNESLLNEQQNMTHCEYSPWNTSNFPKTKVKIKMINVKPKAIDMAEATKKKLLTYAKNMGNFCDRLNLQ